MKLSKLAFVILIAICNGAYAQSALLATVSGSGAEVDRLAVLDVLQRYLRVTDANDAEAIKQSMHPTALLGSVTASGNLRLMTQEEWWGRVSRLPTQARVRQSQVMLIDVVQSAAVARVDIKDARDRSSTDMFTLQKTNEGWRIVNKVLSTPL